MDPGSGGDSRQLEKYVNDDVWGLTDTSELAALRQRGAGVRSITPESVAADSTRQGLTVLPSQAEVIGAVEAATADRDVAVCAAGSLPGDLHKRWRTRDPKGYHVEYGYSCMGYEVAGGLGVKLAAPEREVFVMVGDGSYLMMHTELVTALWSAMGTDRRPSRPAWPHGVCVGYPKWRVNPAVGDTSQIQGTDVTGHR